MSTSFKATAPGSLMLLGEYAVLQGKSALVCAIDKYMTVILTPRRDKKIFLTSSLGTYVTEVGQLKIEPPFQFILATLKKFQKKLITGCDIEVIAGFSNNIGFASSASVTVATLAALSAWLNLAFTPLELVRNARTIVREVQGVGSGADVAACVFGGIIDYKAPAQIEKLPYHFPITAIYSGSKVPTGEAIKRVNDFFNDKPMLLKKILAAIDECVMQGKQAIYRQNWPQLGKLMNIQQGLMEALGVNNSILQSIVYTLKEQANIFGAKISGSGFGDCVIGLGTCDVLFEKGMAMPINITAHGVVCEKN